MSSIRRFVALVLFLASFVGIGHAQGQGSVVRLSPKLDAIVSPGAKVEELGGVPGAGTREGAVWVRQGGYLLYTDLGDQSVIKWDPATGTSSVFVKDAGAYGITLDRQGRLVWVGHQGVVRLEKDGKRTILATGYQGKPFNAPNDLVSTPDGALYFTDPGRMSITKDHKIVYIDHVSSVYLLKDGKVHLLTTKVWRCNGIAVSPGGRYLYVGSSADMVIMRFKLLPGDTIGPGQLFIDENADRKNPYPSTGFPDGMTVDEKGDVYTTGPGGIWIISPSGRHLGTIVGVGRAADAAFGGPDGKTLFITDRPGLYRIPLKVAGVRP